MKKKLFTLAELLIWLTLAVGIIFFIISIFHPDLKIKKIYEVDFRDIDSVIIGSPVRFMGVDIGHVKEIKVLKDKVRLKLAITKDEFKLPKNSLIKIEASSLGGSRSLELFPSSEIFQSKEIIAVEPQRINEVFLSSSEFVESMAEGMANMKILLSSILESEEYKNIDEINKKMEDIVVELNDLSSNLTEKQQLSSINLELTKTNLSTQLSDLKNIQLDKDVIKAQTKNLQNSLDKVSEELSYLDKKVMKKQSHKIYKQTNNIKSQINKVDIKKEMDDIICDIKALKEFLVGLDEALETNNLEKAKIKVKSIKELTKELNKKL